VLKWSYAYGYFMKTVDDKNLFEFLQENLEKNCEGLHEMIEKPLDEYLDEDCLEKKSFYALKSKMISHTSSTKTYYTNILTGLEKGLKNVN